VITAALGVLALLLYVFLLGVAAGAGAFAFLVHAPYRRWAIRTIRAARTPRRPR